jgi:hypothetical protein
MFVKKEGRGRARLFHYRGDGYGYFAWDAE